MESTCKPPTLGHLAPLHFHFTELNPGAQERCAQEKATGHKATSVLGPRSARARGPRAAPARGSPGANLLPLILGDAGARATAPGASRRGPAGPHAEGQIVPTAAAPRAPPRPRSPRPSSPASASGGGKWAAARPPAPPSGAWRVYEAPQGKVIGFRAQRCRERRKAAAEAAARGRRRARRGREGCRRRWALPRPGDLAGAGCGGKPAAAGKGKHACPRGPRVRRPHAFPRLHLVCGAHLADDTRPKKRLGKLKSVSIPQGFPPSSDVQLRWKKSLSFIQYASGEFLSFTNVTGNTVGKYLKSFLW